MTWPAQRLRCLASLALLVLAGPDAFAQQGSAPAEARQTAAVTRAEPCEGTITPVAPAPAALRTTAPRFLGSVTWSRQHSKGRSSAASSQPSAYGYGSHHATTPWWSVEPAASFNSRSRTFFRGVEEIGEPTSLKQPARERADWRSVRAWPRRPRVRT